MIAKTPRISSTQAARLLLMGVLAAALLSVASCATRQQQPVYVESWRLQSDGKQAVEVE